MQEALKQAVKHWNMVAPVIDTPKSIEDYDELLINIKDAMELIDNRDSSMLSGLINAMAKAARGYENSIILDQQNNALSALKFLIKLHRIKQSELKEIGSQGVVSEILNGKRTLTIRHVKELSKKFCISPNVFIDS